MTLTIPTTAITSDLRQFLVRRSCIVRAQPHGQAKQLRSLKRGESVGGWVIRGMPWVGLLGGGYVSAGHVAPLEPNP